MTKPDRPPTFGPTYWIGKCRLNWAPDIVASLMKANAETFFANCTTKLPMNLDASTEPALEQAELALVSQGA